MKQFLIAGNWKMNGTTRFCQEFIDTFSNQLSTSFQQCSLLIPPYPYLSQVKNLLEDTSIHLGAQNISEHQDGAYTGEVSGNMLKDIGCGYVLVGHSERRILYHESNEIVAAKFKAAKQAGLTPILCVGETLDEREQGIAFDVIKSQLDAVIAACPEQTFDSSVIAYEPVWAIGTGQTASPEQAQEIHGNIANYVAQLQHGQSNGVQILYGGSVKPDNAEALFSMPDIHGGLIGGASLKVDQFVTICDIAQQVSDSCNN